MHVLLFFLYIILFSSMWNDSGISTRLLDGAIVVNTTHLTSFVVLVSHIH